MADRPGAPVPGLLWSVREWPRLDLRLGAGAGRDEITRLCAYPDTLVLFDPGAVDLAGRHLAVSATGLEQPWSLARLIRRRRAARVVAVGGGSLLDLAKLGCALAAGCEPRYAGPARSGLALLSPGTRPGPELTAVPTTLGTGAESSGVARLPLAGGRSRLVCGAALRPGRAVLDPTLTATLPAPLLALGVLEVLLRLVGPVLGPHPLGAVAADHAVHCAGRVRSAGDTLLRRKADPVEQDRLRMVVAAVSAASQRSWAMVGRSPYAFRLWYLADVVAAATGIPKMAAMAWLFPPYVQCVLAGGPRSPWGNRSRATRVVGDVFGIAGRDPADVATALDRAMAAWGISRRAPDVAPATMADEALSSWPAQLAGLEAGELRDLFLLARG